MGLNILTQMTKNETIEKMSPTMLQADLKQGAFQFGRAVFGK